MKDVFRKAVFFLSVAVTTLGFAPLSGGAATTQAPLSNILESPRSAKEVEPLQLDKAIKSSKADSFMELANHYSHSSHRSHYSHRSSY